MKKFSPSTVAIAALGVTLATAGPFGYWYGLRKAPAMVENLKTTVTVASVLATPPKYLTSIQGKTPETAMKEPLSVTVGANGRVFVADTGNGRVQAYDPNGQFLYEMGRQGPEESQLEMPATLASHNGLLYVGDVRKSAILIYQESGQYVRSITSKDLGVTLSPLAMAFDGDSLFVASGPGYVFVLGPDGKLASTIGKPGGPDGYLGYPNGIAILNGNVMVADSNNQRIQVFDKSGNLVSVKTDLGFGLPRGMVVDRLGRLFVVDTFNHNVVALDKELKQVFRFGDRGMEEGRFNFPNQLAVDDTGRVYVADRENNRVAVFGY